MMNAWTKYRPNAAPAMARGFKTLTASLPISLAIMCAAPAFAEGTAPGTDVVNTITASYDVGGVTQSSVNAADTFKVDRKVIFSLTEAPVTGTTMVGPGQDKQVTRFQVTNTSNDTLDFTMGVANVPTGTNSPNGGQDSIDLPWLWHYVDVNKNGIYEPATDNVWYVDNLGPDQSQYIFVVVDIPPTATNGQIGMVQLSVTARDASGSFSNILDFNVATDSTANGAGTVETVFADAAKSGLGGISQARDGIDKAFDDYTVIAANLSVYKSSRIISDGVSDSNFKTLPGALVEYCVSVANGAGGASALVTRIRDLVPANMTYVAASVRINATVTAPGPGQSCTDGTPATDSAADADGASFGTPANTVVGSLANIDGGNASALIFRATIN